MAKFIDLLGCRFGRLVVTSRNGTQDGAATWNCVCDCGNTSIAMGYRLRQGHTTSCGCARVDACRDTGRKKKHGLFGSDIYSIFYSAKERCQNKNSISYKRYGGRGIQFKFDSIEDFANELGPRPSKHHTVDRIDNDGHYAPGNIRWATPLEQNANQSKTVYATIDGVTKPASWWRRELGLSKSCYDGRIRQGYSPEDALLKPVQKRRL